MVDIDLLKYLKKRLGEGAKTGNADDTIKVYEFFKQVASENDELKEAVATVDLKGQVIITDIDRKFWFSHTGGNIEYGEGEIDGPDFTFLATLPVFSEIIFGEKEGSKAFGAKELNIEGNVAKGIAYNNFIVHGLDLFGKLTADL